VLDAVDIFRVRFGKLSLFDKFPISRLKSSSDSAHEHIAGAPTSCDELRPRKQDGHLRQYQVACTIHPSSTVNNLFFALPTFVHHTIPPRITFSPLVSRQSSAASTLRATILSENRLGSPLSDIIRFLQAAANSGKMALISPYELSHHYRFDCHGDV
jgi:hypothetical protein